MEIKQIQQRFAKDVASHKMHVAHDDGLYRTIAFKQDGELNHHFTISTHPHYLLFTGDMGSFVFSKSAQKDMFIFFRNSNNTNCELGINYGYWGEKIDAGVYSQFDIEHAVNAAMQLFNQHNEDTPINFDSTNFDSIEEIREELEWAAEENEHEFFSTFEGIAEVFAIDDWYEIYNRYSKPTYHYIWCCYAIVWAIAQYDAMKEKEMQ